MIPKVKVKSELFQGEIVYTIRSKSLTAALQRATLLVEALGERFTALSYVLEEREGKADRHYFYISA